LPSRPITPLAATAAMSAMRGREIKFIGIL
jgi:hypothetical protein